MACGTSHVWTFGGIVAPLVGSPCDCGMARWPVEAAPTVVTQSCAAMQERAEAAEAKVQALEQERKGLQSFFCEAHQPDLTLSDTGVCGWCDLVRAEAKIAALEAQLAHLTGYVQHKVDCPIRHWPNGRRPVREWSHMTMQMEWVRDEEVTCSCGLIPSSQETGDGSPQKKEEKI